MLGIDVDPAVLLSRVPIKNFTEIDSLGEKTVVYVDHEIYADGNNVFMEERVKKHTDIFGIETEEIISRSPTPLPLAN